MRKVKVNQIKDKVKELFLKANYHIDQELMGLLQKSLKEETSPIGQSVLQMIIENNQIASSEEIAICQDTGLAVLFIELGQEVQIIDGDFRESKKPTRKDISENQ